ncbi:coiled-coil domain-containing protein 137 [Polymixia lowei]
MGKNRQVQSNKPEKKAGKAGQHPSAGKHKRDGKKNKPKGDDHLSQIPFRLREIMKNKERMKMGTSRAKKIKEAVVPKAKTDDSGDGDIKVPHFKRRKKESEKAYLGRMANEAQHVLFLTKNQVDRKPELDTGKPETQGKSDKKKEHDQLRLQRLHLKKLGRREDKMEKEMFIDKVEFGDVAMAPPTLSVKPKKAPVKSQNASKELLLNSLLGHTAASTAKPSMARKRIMEEERERAVEAYRHLKKQKQQQREARIAGLETLKNL